VFALTTCFSLIKLKKDIQSIQEPKRRLSSIYGQSMWSVMGKIFAYEF